MRFRTRTYPAPNSDLGTKYYSWIWNPTVKNVGGGPWTVADFLGGFPNASVENCWDVLHSGPPYTEGGPFNKWVFSTDIRSPQGGGNFSTLSGNLIYSYEGAFVPIADLLGYMPGTWYPNPGIGASFTADGAHSWGDFSSYGASAWKKYRPGRNTAEAGVFIGEIRDLPRMLYGTARHFKDAFWTLFGKRPRGKMRTAADAWLNTQFGWLPFLHDLVSFHKTWKNADTLIKQVIRDNGQWIRRGGVVTQDEESEVLVDLDAGNNPAVLRLNPYLESFFFQPGSCGNFRITRVTRHRSWFSARFRYHIPNVGSVQWKANAVRRLYGLTLDPTLVWELIPWSWLIDWFTNVGDIISNVSNPGLVQNLAAKYAYLMGTTQVELTQDVTARLVGGTRKMAWHASLERKQRVEANPFGFGVSWEALSPRQWSILGALGLTRLH